MRLQEFINALTNAGWRDTNDAQHEQIAFLHESLFPTVAALEGELLEANEDIDRMVKGFVKP